MGSAIPGPNGGNAIPGDISMGANKLKTTTHYFYEMDTSYLALRRISDDASRGLDLGVLVATSMRSKIDAGDLRARDTDDNYFSFLARDSTIGMVEIARMVGAADPHFAVNSEEDGRTLAFNYGNIAITNYKVAKVTKAHAADLFDAAATTDSVAIWTQPVNSRLIAVMMRLETQFAGTSWTDLRVTLGLAGDPDGLVATTGNLTSDAADTEYENVGAYYDAFMEGLHGKTNATIAWIAYATATGGNLNVSTAGTMDFYFLYEEP